MKKPTPDPFATTDLVKPWRPAGTVHRRDNRRYCSRCGRLALIFNRVGDCVRATLAAGTSRIRHGYLCDRCDADLAEEGKR